MDTVIAFIKGTPWYVYLILIYLVYIGCKAVKGGVVHIAKLFVLPAIFVLMSIDTLINGLGMTLPYLGMWLLGIGLGAFLGWWQFKRLKIQVDQQKKLLKIEGSWFALYLIVLTFIVKYYIGYTVAIDYNISSSLAYFLLVLSGLFTGAFIGRLLYGLYKLKIGPHIELE